MLYRPKFCANCGDAIERAHWFVWTSRRFCEVCEVELKGHELVPRAIVALVLLVSLGAVVASFSSRPSGSFESARLSGPSIAPAPRSGPVEKRPVEVVPSTEAAVSGQPATAPQASTTGRNTPVNSRPPVVVEESARICAAETKKGTPCSRRVKGNDRCYQHLGMPAMEVAQKQEPRPKTADRTSFR